VKFRLCRHFGLRANRLISRCFIPSESNVSPSFLVLEHGVSGRLRPDQDAGNGLLRPRHARPAQIHQEILRHEDPRQTEGKGFLSDWPSGSPSFITGGALIERAHDLISYSRAQSTPPFN